MAKKKAGKVMILPRGNWDASVAYTILDLVNAPNSATYLAKKDVPAGTPLTDETYWQEFLGSEYGGLSREAKLALLECFKYVTWVDDQGQARYDALRVALNIDEEATLESITAIFSQGSNIIYDDATLDSLKQYLTVKANYSDSTSTNVANYTLSGTLTAGTSTITVTYEDKTTTFNVTVTHKEATLQSITAVFDQGSNVIYDDAALEDLKQYLTVTANYSDSTSVNVTNYSLSGALAAGTSTITVVYENKTTTFNVTVTHREVILQSITAVFNQGGIVIYDDTVLDDLKQYLTVTGHYSDSTTATITGYTLSGTLTAGTSTITVTYNNKTTTFNVTVTHKPATLQSITAAFNQGSAVIYDDATLDSLKQYLTVTGYYSDSTTATITGYILSGTLAAGTSAITVTYEGKAATFNVTVTHKAIIPEGYSEKYVIIAGEKTKAKNANEILTDYQCNSQTNMIIKGKLTVAEIPDGNNTASLFTDHSADGYGIALNRTKDSSGQWTIPIYPVYRGGVRYNIQPDDLNFPRDSVHTFELYANDVLKRDGIVIGTSITDGGKTSGKGICIFGDTHDLSEIYSFKIYEGDTLVRNYVPCVRESDSMAGFYDTVEGQFWGNANLTSRSVPVGYTEKTAIVAGSKTNDKNANEILTDYYLNSATRIVARCRTAMEFTSNWAGASIFTDHSTDGYGFQVSKNSIDVYKVSSYRGGTQYMLENVQTDSNSIYTYEFWPNNAVLRDGTAIIENVIDGGKTSGKGMCILGDTHINTVLYYLKVYEGDTLVRNYVPCVRDSDSMAGFYDTVEDQFWSNENLAPLQES